MENNICILHTMSLIESVRISDSPETSIRRHDHELENLLFYGRFTNFEGEESSLNKQQVDCL